MHLFYTPGFSEKKSLLNKEESHHCINVMRFSKSSIVYVTNGRGDLYKAEIEEPDPSGCRLKIIEKQSGFGKRDYNLTIGICPTKNPGRFEFFIEKSTEIGIDNIIPLICSSSERKKINPERIERIITSAMKQSLKAYRPILEKVQDLKEALKDDFEGQKFIASESVDPEMNLGSLCKPGENVFVLIGAEGGFSEREMEQAAGSGFIPVSLGDYRLRTETAGIVACHTVHLVNNLER